MKHLMTNLHAIVKLGGGKMSSSTFLCLLSCVRGAGRHTGHKQVTIAWLENGDAYQRDSRDKMHTVGYISLSVIIPNYMQCEQTSEEA